MNRDLSYECGLARERSIAAAREEMRLFCAILDISFESAYLVGETRRNGADPFGVACIGDYFFNMSDIHVVIAHYEKWISRYGSNDAIGLEVVKWYDYKMESEKNKCNIESWLSGINLLVEQLKPKKNEESTDKGASAGRIADAQDNQ